MALDFLKLHDATLADSYHKKAEKDRTPQLRAKVIEGIDAALAALKKGEDSVKSWFSTSNGVSKLQVRHGLKPLGIAGQGKHDHFVPRERAADFYNGVKDAVKAGHLDDVLKRDTAANASAPTSRAAASGGVRATSSTRSEAMKAAWAKRKEAAGK
jgi:hypothetical protein